MYEIEKFIKKIFYIFYFYSEKEFNLNKYASDVHGSLWISF